MKDRLVDFTAEAAASFFFHFDLPITSMQFASTGVGVGDPAGRSVLPGTTLPITQDPRLIQQHTRPEVREQNMLFWLRHFKPASVIMLHYDTVGSFR